MTINRKELFTLAWAIARQDQWSRRLPSLRGLFGDALRQAWREMKRRAELAAKRPTPTLRPAADLMAGILDLENRDRLRGAELERLSSLRAEYAVSVAQRGKERPKPGVGLRVYANQMLHTSPRSL
jgi:hypothetical protein